ncbi:16S rRNA (cytosine(1402)-N(4))-methyltransferase RsmH [Roseitranquillus sediminis]|uniref:16S rRNA (cytosine(1402)-N(4))-methyltransferase RsmH n=1 Tax=Roseitranquillus sediminis TaxID=2809051 RepID=UPI001D0C8838|nr:16S rRNA (cytosine(1402)-N(4))-methyltransferase RsmH [Roseitranquillus sediminis]MBM9594594.1 16S rRNA (cytosine(1402)-N(4))-methyltransferase RsmH [Roseitranquillus sediminis]
MAVHVPVLLEPLLRAVAPVRGTWLDGTFGAGGYARGLLDAGAERVIGVDRDSSALDAARDWAAGEPRLTLVEGTFGRLDELAKEPLDGVVLDLGVSSMQLDQGERGFSFRQDGPLDMRMGNHGPTAADVVNESEEGQLADILYRYGEERASRRIARAVVAARPLRTTGELAAVVERCLPRAKPGQSHPATRSFQAIRIAVNDEFGELAQGLGAAERALTPGGRLAVVTFHSIEDRAVKRFFQSGSSGGGRANRFAPEAPEQTPRWRILGRAVAADEEETDRNPRARSARLRVAERTDAPAQEVDPRELGLPQVGGLR